MTQQGASKHVVELERLGYVERVADVGDSRVRRVRMTDRGRDAVDVARKARRDLDDQVSRGIGAGEVASTRRALAQMLDVLGVGDQVRSRTVRAPRSSE